MIKGFSTKKIKNEETLGEKLRNSRKRQEIRIADAEIGAKVRAEYLVALEKSDWKQLPSNVYVRGFVLAYAKYLGIDKSEAIPLFETEARIQRKEKDISIMYQNSIKDTKVLFTPKIFGYGALSLFILSMFGYIVYQLVNFAGSPNLKITMPNNNIIIENDATDISGITDNDSVLMINNETIPVTKDGHFSTTLKLHKGINIIKVQAKNKAKKETTEVVTVEYKPKTALINIERNQ